MQVAAPDADKQLRPKFVAPQKKTGLPTAKAGGDHDGQAGYEEEGGQQEDCIQGCGEIIRRRGVQGLIGRSSRLGVSPIPACRLR